MLTAVLRFKWKHVQIQTKKTMEQPASTTHDKLALEHDWTLHELDIAREPFLNVRERVRRTDGLDSHLNELFKFHELHLNHLLEEYFAKFVQIPEVQPKAA